MVTLHSSEEAFSIFYFFINSDFIRRRTVTISVRHRHFQTHPYTERMWKCCHAKGQESPLSAFGLRGSKTLPSSSIFRHLTCSLLPSLFLMVFPLQENPSHRYGSVHWLFSQTWAHSTWHTEIDAGGKWRLSPFFVLVLVCIGVVYLYILVCLVCRLLSVEVWIWEWWTHRFPEEI